MGVPISSSCGSIFVSTRLTKKLATLATRSIGSPRPWRVLSPAM